MSDLLTRGTLLEKNYMLRKTRTRNIDDDDDDDEMVMVMVMVMMMIIIIGGHEAGSAGERNSGHASSQ